jgi:hypothetical protein
MCLKQVFNLTSDHSSSRGMHLVYLPPYSPDYNPIEEGFLAMKAWIRCKRNFAIAMLARGADAHPMDMLWTAVHKAMTPESIWGWY